jgi:SAM-dependent methyltransferase
MNSDPLFPPLRSLTARGRAWALSRENPRYDAVMASRKTSLFSGLRGTLLELGPGGGHNFRYFDPSIHWIGLEPNPFCHPWLKKRAEARGIAAEIRLGSGEAIPAPDASVDNVVATLVLCTVPDPRRTLGEILRVLKPGGKFAFIEHVAAPKETGMRSVQRMIRPLWKRTSGGCHPDRETEELIVGAGFRNVRIERFKVSMSVIAPHIAGSGEAPGKDES